MSGYKKFIDEKTILLGEDRKKNMKYIQLDKKKKVTDVTASIDKVVTVLRKNQSENAKMLGEEFLSLDFEVKKLSIKRDAVKETLKEFTKDFFDAEDEIYTRIIKTSEISIQLSKVSNKPSLKVDPFLEEVYNLIPGMKTQIEALKQKYTEVTSVAARLAVEPIAPNEVEESFKDTISDIGNKIKKVAGFFLKSIRNWGRDYDTKLNDIYLEFRKMVKENRANTITEASLAPNILKDFEQRAEAERQAGGFVEINYGLPSVSITLSDGSDYFFQEHEADDLLGEVPTNIADEDYLLAVAQGW